jgi:catechol 2,3-dioxygenase-like lactoylglutathione lyase family enzyme
VPPDHADPDHAGHLHHLELNSPDPADSVAFWHWFLGALGYESKDEFEGGYSWRLGATYVVLKRAESELPHERRRPDSTMSRSTPGLGTLDDTLLFSRIVRPECGRNL